MTRYGDFVVEQCGNAEVFFLFDDDMTEEVCGNTWTLDGNGYVCRNKDGKLERLHTLVVKKNIGGDIPEGAYVDHINQCKTDNRRCNLRIVSPQDSAKNMPLKANNTTGVAGVSLGRGGKGYRAYITVDKRRIELGTYKTLEEAARVRYAAEEKYGFTHRQNLAAFLIEMEEQEKRPLCDKCAHYERGVQDFPCSDCLGYKGEYNYFIAK